KEVRLILLSRFYSLELSCISFLACLFSSVFSLLHSREVATEAVEEDTMEVAVMIMEEEEENTIIMTE
ncbi:hypothetical protein PENTCL1PPCAC_24943, partial [Pristionchus entomophagus]